MLRFCLTLCALVCAANASSDSLWHRLRTKYLSLKTLSGTFEERICSEQAGTCQDFEGNFFIRVPSRYRLQVTAPVKQLIVSDSTTLWLYFPDEKRALRQPAGGLAPVFVFLGPILDSTATAEVVRDSAGGYVAKVNMGDSLAAMADLQLELDKTVTRVKAFSFTDAWGNNYHFTLSNQEWNPKLSNKVFRFAPPPGTTIED